MGYPGCRAWRCTAGRGPGAHQVVSRCQIDECAGVLRMPGHAQVRAGLGAYEPGHRAGAEAKWVKDRQFHLRHPGLRALTVNSGVGAQGIGLAAVSPWAEPRVRLWSLHQQQSVPSGAIRPHGSPHGPLKGPSDVSHAVNLQECAGGYRERIVDHHNLSAGASKKRTDDVGEVPREPRCLHVGIGARRERCETPLKFASVGAAKDELVQDRVRPEHDHHHIGCVPHGLRSEVRKLAPGVEIGWGRS